MWQYWQDITTDAYITWEYTTGPGTWLMFTLIALTLAIYAFTLLMLEGSLGSFTSFAGKRDAHGMRRLWMYNKEPYLAVWYITSGLVGSVIAAVLLMMMLGMVTLGVFWVIFGLMYVLVWLGYILIIGGIGGIYGAFSGEGGEGCAVAAIGIPIGGLIVAFEDNIHAAGDAFRDWGIAAWDTLNLFGWIHEMLAGTWRFLLVVALTPIVIFLAIALVVMALVAIVTLVEWCVMRYYRVHRRCPKCGHDDFEYIVQGKTYPVALHPGVYGVLHHRYDGVKVPTMMLNGKGRLPRRCRHCNHRVVINAPTTFGTDVHVGFVGGPSTGKSWLIYGAMARLLQLKGKHARQVDKGRHTDIAAMHALMEQGRSFQTSAEQFTHAVQVMVDRNGSRVPWHLHCWDVAGENFDRELRPTELDFYRHVTHIVMVVDPALCVYRSGSAEPLASWLNKRNRPLYDLDETLSHVTAVLGGNGRDPQEIELTVVLAKCDTGYLRNAEAKTSDELLSWVRAAMRQPNFVANVTNRFKRVTFMAVSVTTGGHTSVDRLLNHLFPFLNE